MSMRIRAGTRLRWVAGIVVPGVDVTVSNIEGVPYATIDLSGVGGGLDEAEVQALIDATVAAVIGGAPGALDTLNELAAAINDDASFASAVTSALAGKQPLDSDLTAIAAIAPSNDDLIQRKAGVWTNRTIAQLLVDLAAAGTTFQPLDADLTAVAAVGTQAYGRSILAWSAAAGAVADIATPADATAEDVATKLNALLDSLRTRGVIAS